ncbi:MAG: immune inhibitor A [Crocinitomicaceae bacterium]|nr:immune inhibitor A [Crocinitomicaceae bacterium]
MLKIFFFLSIAIHSGFSFGQHYAKVKIYTDAVGMQLLGQLGLAVDHGEHKENTFIISDFSEREIQILEQNGFEFDVLIEDAKAYYLKRNQFPEGTAKNVNCVTSGGGVFVPEVPVNFFENSSYAGFYKYQDMLDALDAMVAQYPSLITVKAPISSFLTHEGRPIYHVKISDNPSSDDVTEPNVLYSAIHHAREPMSMSQTIFYMWYLLENYATNEEVQFLIDNTEMYFVPCLNPDGYIHNEANDPNGMGMHRKNKAPVGSSNPGVDLNRNYSYGWNTTGVSPDPNNDTYPGTSAFSEPETQAMKWLVETHGFVSAFNAHSYGNLLLYPVGTTTAEFADHNDYFVDLCANMVSLNGYHAMKGSGLYPASGDSDDYMYKADIGVGMKDTIFAMTPEVGTDFWPAQSEVEPTCQSMVFSNMVLSHMAHKYLVVKDEDPAMIADLTGGFNHSARRLGLVDGVVDVSIEPLLNIQSVGAPVTHDLQLRQFENSAISYVLNPGIQFGDQIKYVLQTEYATWTKRDTIVKTFGSLTLQLADDASSTTNWTGGWTLTNDEAYSPPTSFTESDGGDYLNNTNETYELIQNIDLTNATDAMVTFYAKWNIESDYDYCQFQVSVNGGGSWIGQCGKYTVEGSSTLWNGSVQPDGEPVYEGASDWVYEEVSLSAYLGQVIKVRFQFESDGGVTQDGFYFDDFQVSFNEGVGLMEQTFEVMAIPNPANDQFYVSTSKVIEHGLVRVIDQTGKIVIEKEIKALTNKITIETIHLPEGLYTVQVFDNGNYAKPTKLVVIH